MPVADTTSSGRTFIWLIASILFISILAGGGCLVAYLLLPESQVTPWIPVVGVALDSLPWAFWIFTFLYRIFSRCCGFRLRFGVANIGGGEGGAANAGEKIVAQSNGGIDRTLSIASHVSEMPLAKSMAY